MNKNIELVKKWLADNDSVSYKELWDNADDAVRASELTDAVVGAADYAMAEILKRRLIGSTYARS